MGNQAALGFPLSAASRRTARFGSPTMAARVARSMPLMGGHYLPQEERRCLPHIGKGDLAREPNPGRRNQTKPHGWSQHGRVGCRQGSEPQPLRGRGRPADEALPSWLCALAGSGAGQAHCRASREAACQPCGCGIAPGDDGRVGRVARRFDGPMEEGEGGPSGHGNPARDAQKPHTLPAPLAKSAKPSVPGVPRDASDAQHGSPSQRALATGDLREVASATRRDGWSNRHSGLVSTSVDNWRPAFLTPSGAGALSRRQPEFKSRALLSSRKEKLLTVLVPTPRPRFSPCHFRTITGTPQASRDCSAARQHHRQAEPG